MNIDTNRVEALSDGIIAIIITIMVLEFKLPDLGDDPTTHDIQNHLWHLSPYFATYFLSYLIIGIFWAKHHQMFHLLDRLNDAVLWQNFFFLFSLSFIPFFTALLGANPLLPASVAFYGTILLITTIAFAIIRTYTLRKKMVHKDDTEQFNRQVRRIAIRTKNKSYLAIASYLLSVPMAFVSVYISYACFIIAPIFFFIPDGVDDEEVAEKVIEKNK